MVLARDYDFQIYHRLTTSIAFSVQAANIDEYYQQLPAGANLALMVQRFMPAGWVDYHSQADMLPAAPKVIYRAGGVAPRPGFPFTPRETKGTPITASPKGDVVALRYIQR